MTNRRSANGKSAKVMPVNWLRKEPNVPKTAADTLLGALAPPAENLPARLAQVAPLAMSNAVGLPPGATIASCVRERLLTAAVVEADVAAIRELLARLETLEPKREVIVNVRWGQRRANTSDLLTDSKVPNPDALRRAWVDFTGRVLAGEGEVSCVSAWDHMSADEKARLWAELKDGLRMLGTELEAQRNGVQTVQ